MKKMLLTAMLIVACTAAFAQEKQAQIKFNKTTLDLGKFSEAQPVPAYTKEPVAPGKTGQIKVTYNGKGKFPGHFKKSITVRTNGKPEMTRLYIEGTMEEAK